MAATAGAPLVITGPCGAFSGNQAETQHPDQQTCGRWRTGLPRLRTAGDDSPTWREKARLRQGGCVSYPINHGGQRRILLLTR